jgi:hypothetical protein
MSFVEGVVADDAVKISGNYTSLEFLQAAYRCEELSLHVRMRAAMAALPFEYPKLAVTVQTTPQDFAARLDAAIARSERARIIEATPERRSLPPTGPAPTPAGAPFASLRRL